MENLKCPYCGLINPPETKQCSCGYTFDKELYRQISEQQQISEVKQRKINFFKKNQLGIIVFSVILGLRYIWIIQSARIGLDYIAALVTILFDSPIALIIAALAQWISNKFKKQKNAN